MNRKVLACQTAVCLCITAVAVLGKNIDNVTFSSCYDKVSEQVMHQITREEVTAMKDNVINVVKNAPAEVVDAVSKVNSQSKYGEPIDKKSNDDVKQVHAVAGGEVIQSGYSKDLGLFLKLKHENAVSVYGQLSDLNVVESERVQKGEIIGAYDTKSEKEFYYQLKENL